MPLPKPRSPVLQPGLIPGCRDLFPLVDSNGPAFANLAAPGRPLITQGAPTRSIGAYGREVGGFSASNYIFHNHPGYLGGVFPFWMAAMFRVAASADQFIMSAASSTSPNQTIGLRVISGTSVAWMVRANDAGTGSGVLPPATVPTILDGRYHVLQGVSYSATDHRLFLDGSQVAASTTALGTTTVDRLTLGALLRNGSVFTWLTGGSIVFAASGAGAVPSPARLSRTWITGRFQEVRPSSTAMIYTPPGSFSPSWLAQRPLLGTGIF